MNEKFAHTPGPWRFYTEPQPNGCPIVGDGKGLMVAMLAHTVNQADQKEKAFANARLIASAPELLEALDMLLNDVGRANSMLGAVKARAAIAKAGS